MSLSAHVSGAWKGGSMYVRVSGAWKLLTPSVHASSAWKGVGGGGTPLSASVNFSSLYGTFAESGTGSAGVSTASGAGGTAPYTYAWSRVSGDSAIGAVTQNIAATEFRVSGGRAGDAYDAIWQCVVTDSDGNTAVALVSIHFDFDSGS